MYKHMLRAVVVLLACADGSGLAVAQSSVPQFIPGSTLPRMQLTGEHFQIFPNGTYFNEITSAQTLTRYGILGSDLGYPITVGDRTYFLFGDTIGNYLNAGRYTQARLNAAGSNDALGYISNTDLRPCRYIPEVDLQILQGNSRPTVSQGACPSLRFFANAGRASDELLFKPIVISGLLAGESQGAFRVPSSGFMYNNRMYVFFTSRIRDADGDGVPEALLQSLLAKSDQPVANWTDQTPPSFTRLYTVSAHSPLADPANPPAEAGEPGKLMYSIPMVMDSAALSAAGLLSGLPAELRTAASVLFVYSASYRITRSNVFLAAVALADVEAGPSRWFYYRGNSQWSSNEVDAAPLLEGTPNVGNFSVKWISALQRFVMLRTTVGQISGLTATTPWGPWSPPVTLYTIRDTWSRKLSHHTGDPIVRSLVPIYDRNGSPIDIGNGEGASVYGPYLLDQITQNPDGTVTLYYTLSLWNPYQAFLFSSTVSAGAPLPTASTVNAASFAPGALASGAIASLFGSGLAPSTSSTPSTTTCPSRWQASASTYRISRAPLLRLLCFSFPRARSISCCRRAWRPAAPRPPCCAISRPRPARR
ncbi:MAG: DUF4185 domain-containing protein [Acidobacteria bacterium]|nr:DUF4185 domain-containing protein [Acidobacteriota bacterium]